MNSLAVYSLFLFLPAFLVCASEYNVYILKTPYNFKFKVNDVLNMDIAMLNIPPNVYYFSVNSGEKSLINKFEISRWVIWHIIIDTLATQNSYHSIQLLLYEKYDSNNACTTVNIAQGQPKNSLRSISEQDETDDCLNDKHCTIAVDFRNSCTKTVPYFKCSTIDPLVICTKHEYEEATFTWHQFYDDGSYIGTTPEIKATISSFIYTLQNFDNNTFVKALPGNSRSNTLKMNNVIPEYRTESKLTFNDSTNIEFDCEIYLQQTKYVNVGLINTTENKITTLNTTKINKKYGAEYNGSILCCLYYTTQKISENIPEINVIRHVQDTTLLLYSTATPEPLPYFYCSSFDRVVMCSKQEYKEATFTWQQFYDDGTYIGTIPEIKATMSKFIYTLQNFDNNTFVKALPGNSRSNTIKMNNVIPEYKTESKLTFNDSTDIEFDCETYLQQTKYVYVGLINTTENKITTLNTTKINKKYGAEYNGSILCCLYYTTQKISEKIPEINVIRHVQDTTLLLYSTETPEPLPYFYCSSFDRVVMCSKQEYKEATFTWQQFYDDGSYIGTTPEVKATISSFIYTLQNFDNNTFVKALPGNSRSNTLKMNNVIPEYKTESKLTFNDSTTIEFDCETYLQQTKYVYVGLINTKENKITTLNTTKIYKKYGAEYNGSILCCLYYTTQKISEKIPEINVIRHVQDTTLLLYSTATPEPLPYFNCSSFDRVVMCSKQEYNEATFTWQQFYDDGSYIGTIPEIKATISSFIYTLQNFDNNTFVKALPGNFRSNTIKMKPVITEYRTESKLTFNDSTNIEFDCETYLQQTKYVYVGLINTTENKITTLNTTKINKKYGAEYNGSILCCLYYTTQKISEKIPEINVIRHVQDTTLLLYSTATPEPLPYFNCSSIEWLIVCTKEEHKEATFTWLQLYDDGSYIGTIPEIKVTISTFLFAVEYFDNNTFVKVLPGNSISNKIIVDPDFIPEYRTESKLTFNDSTTIEFDCEIYLQQTKYVYVGLINTTENKITTLNTTKINKKYGAEYNGSILCCLYYTKSELPPEKYVQRYVKNKTLLLYSTEALADSGITTDLTVLYASVTAAVLILAVAITIVVIKRCCNKTPTSSEPKPVSKWEPFYENKLLLLRKECDREIEAERKAQEPVYEEIL